MAHEVKADQVHLTISISASPVEYDWQRTYQETIRVVVPRDALESLKLGPSLEKAVAVAVKHMDRVVAEADAKEAEGEEVEA